MADKRKISLVLADVDGTLVTEKKVLTERAQAAVRSLHEAGIRFAITSGRPAKGMAMLFDPLEARHADLRLQRRARHQARPHDHRAEDRAGRCRRPGDRADPRPRPRCLGLSRQRLAGRQRRGPARRARGLDRQVRAQGREGRGGGARPGLQGRRRQRRSGSGAALRGRRPGRPSASARRPTARSPITSM